MIHSGSVIAAGISQGRSTSLKRDFKVSSLLVQILSLRVAVCVREQGLPCSVQVCSARAVPDTESEGPPSGLPWAALPVPAQGAGSEPDSQCAVWTCAFLRKWPAAVNSFSKGWMTWKGQE